MNDPNSAKPPTRAEHIGSLLRPQRLRTAFEQYRTRKITAHAFEIVRDSCIDEVLRMQIDCGLCYLTDGEFRRSSWMWGFVDAVDGMTNKPTSFHFTDAQGGDLGVDVPHVGGRLSRKRGIATHEFAYANAHIAGAPRARIKVTLPSPSAMHFMRGPDGIDRAAYPDPDAFWEALIDIYREELHELGEIGCDYVQLDEVPIALLCDPVVREKIAGWGWSAEALIDRYISAINAVIADRPTGMTIGMHLCRGNYRGKWIASGGYEPIAERLFNEVRVDGFCLEYDDERAGDFEPPRFVPNNKYVVLGLVSSKRPALEPVDLLRQRIDAASIHVPMERLALSPQYGFATAVGGGGLSEDEERAKLTRIVDVATRVWQ